MKNHFCPICKTHLQQENANTKILDLVCRNSDNHFFGKRLQNNQLTKIKVRLSENKSELYMRVNLDENNTEIWSSKTKEKVIINATQDICSKDEHIIRNKIKSYLIIS